MNAFEVIIFAIAWFVFAYFWYGGRIGKKVLHVNKDRPTPAHTNYDGLDYVPTNPFILFGHHFSAIAGAGPIVGPILAYALFGWLPALIWILLGAVFMGAVHDFSALVISIRNEGRSIVKIAESAISPTASILFAVFVWFTLALVQAVFADLTAKTLIEQPKIAFPTIALIFIAIIFGLMIYKLKLNVYISTVIALVALGLSVWAGTYIPVFLNYQVWLIIIIIYSFVASIIPVWILLQPRDYISMYLLIIGMLLGIVGISLLNPPITGPAYVSFVNKGTPLFPMLFVIIACGAISGFHSLVASGTTAKQLDKEVNARKIAYGGMLTEGLLAVLVITMISSVLIWDNTGNSTAPNAFQGFLHQSAEIAFGNALGRTIEILGIPLMIGIQFGILMLNAFILTTLDASARLNRYVMQETLGVRFGGIFKNRYFASGASLVFAYILCIGSGYQIIWPIFGASNQLIGTLALFTASAYLFGIKAPKFYTLIPAFLMLIITESSLFYQIFWKFLPENQYFLLFIAVILFILGLFVAFEATKKIFLTKSI
ncbi:MAG: carbon starvation protein A [Bacteroidetes bacterium CG_4_10_14_3_um_filter_31_20]|nr:MAG: carbon starvation protein A [Bacteroidetes bacterium CG_4_8_14_3_um_filter_31_14]PIY07216.1 MAG: carbon starvation protein A [Bacteroidetes bacterium CG_4_10_14_3_um_filter_31_20]